MRTTLICTRAALLCCATTLFAVGSFAQEAAPLPAAPLPAAPPPEAPPPMAEPAPPVPPPPAPIAAPGAAPFTPPPEAPPVATVTDEAVPAWFRIDSDGGGVQLWAGATHPLGEGIGLASDIYVLQNGFGSYGEFDIGPAITAGPMVITPMIGLQVNWSRKRAAAIVPQLYITGGPDPVYLELWVQNYNYGPLNDSENNDLYFRFFVDYKVSSYFAIGPQVELTMALNDAGDSRETGIASLPVGGSIMLSNYGKASSLLLFAGYETNEEARNGVGDAAFAGRLTFVHNF